MSLVQVFSYTLTSRYRLARRASSGWQILAGAQGESPVPFIEGEPGLMQRRIWSIFLARQLRAKTDIKIDCVDISSDLFPTKPWQTPDVTYHVHDCFKPFPAEFHGQYDVVHVRFWLTFVDNEHVPGLLAEFLKLLSGCLRVPNGASS